MHDVKSEIEGPALEGLVAQHLKAWIDAQTENYSLNFWQTRSKVEVDFVVSGPDCFLAIEVKNGSTVHPKDLRALEIFMQDYPSAQALLLYRGKIRIKEKNILCYPIDEFLMQIDPRSPLPEFQ